MPKRKRAKEPAYNVEMAKWLISQARPSDWKATPRESPIRLDVFELISGRMEQHGDFQKLAGLRDLVEQLRDRIEDDDINGAACSAFFIGAAVSFHMDFRAWGHTGVRVRSAVEKGGKATKAIAEKRREQAKAVWREVVKEFPGETLKNQRSIWEGRLKQTGKQFDPKTLRAWFAHVTNS